jgi:hypothetical protein
MAVLAPFAEVEASLAVDAMGQLANAVAKVVSPSEKAGREFPVIFDAAYIGALEVDSVGPTATALDTDIATFEIVKDCELDIRGKRYTVRQLEPDGAGWTVLRLRLEGC